MIRKWGWSRRMPILKTPCFAAIDEEGLLFFRNTTYNQISNNKSFNVALDTPVLLITRIYFEPESCGKNNCIIKLPE